MVSAGRVVAVPGRMAKRTQFSAPKLRMPAGVGAAPPT